MKKTMGIIILAIAGLMMLSAGLVSADEHEAVSGIVTDAVTEEPIEGATVQVDGVDPVLTDSLGVYNISGVPAGEQSFTASADGYESKTVEAEVSESGEGSANFALKPLEDELEVDDDGGKVAGDRKGYVGVFATATVTGAGTGAFIVATKQGDIEIQIPDDGLESITRRPGQDAGSPEDGDRVAVLVEFVEDAGELVQVARQVIVKPTPQPPIQGAVVSITTNEDGIRILSIMRPDGTIKEVQLGPEGRAPDVGDLVTGFPGRGSNANGERDQDRPPVVRGLVRAAEVSQRLGSRPAFHDSNTDKGPGASRVGPPAGTQAVEMAPVVTVSTIGALSQMGVRSCLVGTGLGAWRSWNKYRRSGYRARGYLVPGQGVPGVGTGLVGPFSRGQD